MKITKVPGFGKYGRIIDDLDFSTMTDEEWMEIGRGHLKNLLTIIRNPKGLTGDVYLKRIEQFGPQIYSGLGARLAKKYGHPVNYYDLKSQEDLDRDDKRAIEIRKYMLEKLESGRYLPRVTGAKDDQGNMLGTFDSGDLGWHSNESSQLNFIPEVSLWGNYKMIGSATGFMQTADYYESVSNSFRSELDDMMVVHAYRPGGLSAAEIESADFSSLMQQSFCPVDGAETPLVLTSPGGIKGLHYTINSVASIKGMSQKESNEVFRQLNRGLFTDEYTYYHHYQHDNDLCMFDNSITLHCRVKGDKARKAYRLQYFPTNLIDSPWYPYSDPEISNLFVEQLTEVVTNLKVTNFKLPIKRDLSI